jgi:hypothetical protein
LVDAFDVVEDLEIAVALHRRATLWRHRAMDTAANKLVVGT